jgi:hypothetical protein
MLRLDQTEKEKNVDSRSLKHLHVLNLTKLNKSSNNTLATSLSNRREQAGVHARMFHASSAIHPAVRTNIPRQGVLVMTAVEVASTLL